MTDLLRVDVLDTLDHLGKKLPCISFIKITMVLQSLKKFSSFTEAVSLNDYSCTR